MEKRMLNIVTFDLGAPLSYRYMRRYAKVRKRGSEREGDFVYLASAKA